VGLALVIRIPNLMEAQIAAGALRSAGFAAEVFDQGFGAMEAPVIESLGGYRVMAPAEQVAEARATLKALRANPVPREPDDAPEPWAAPATSTAWKRKGMRVVALMFLAAPILVILIARLLAKP
jgi:hypothetical protein